MSSIAGGRIVSVLDTRVPSPKRTVAIAALGTTVLHAALFTAALVVSVESRAPAIAGTEERLEIELAEPVEQPRVLPLKQPALEHPTQRSPHIDAQRRAPAHQVDEPQPSPGPAPPSAAAEAAPVLTIDTGDSEIVSGTAASAVGGFSADTGIAKISASDANAKADGTADGEDAEFSSDAALIGGGEWTCPFPSEADDDDIDHATVGLRLEIDASGRTTRVTVTHDPGHGFAREARSCALGKHWSPARDHDGSAIASTAIINVRFDR